MTTQAVLTLALFLIVLLALAYPLAPFLTRIADQQNPLPGSGADQETVFSFGDIKVDLAARSVEKDGRRVHLTPIEYRLLALLIANTGRVLTHRQILREVWGPSHSESAHYVRVYMAHLRQKLEHDPALPKHILTETAVGYRLLQG